METKTIFEHASRYDYNLKIVAFEPTGALQIRVSEDDSRIMGILLTREEGVKLAQALARWTVAKRPLVPYNGPVSEELIGVV